MVNWASDPSSVDITGTPWIYLFATIQSYVSSVPDGRVCSVDALSTHLGGVWVYAYPPHALLPKIFTKIKSDGCIVLLIASAFLLATRFRTLPKLSIYTPCRIPKKQNNAQTTFCGMYSNPSRKHFVFTYGHYHMTDVHLLRPFRQNKHQTS